jgi:hypothetical protein
MQNRVQAIRFYVGIRFETGQRLLLTLKFLQEIRFQIGPTAYLEHFENRSECHMMLEWIVLLYEEAKFVVQILQPQHGANTLIERVFVNGQSASP